MRRLMYFVIGFAAACGCCIYMERVEIQLFSLGLITILAAAAGKDAHFLAKTAVIALGCAAGVFWYGTHYDNYLQSAVSMDGETAQALIRTRDYSYETAYGAACDGTLELDGKTYQVRLYANSEEPLEPGILVSGEFRFRTTTAGGMEEATHHQGKGIFLMAYQRGEITQEETEPDWRDYPARLRETILHILASCFPEDTRSFARALLLGDTSELSYAADTDFQISGIRHIIAVSGLHISILFTLISQASFRNRFLKALIGFPVLFLFGAAAGFTPSVTRACIMSALMLIAALVNREYDGPTALSFAVLFMLLGNPLVITSVGFQLSVGSVAGIFLFASGIQKWLLSRLGGRSEKNRMSAAKRWFASSVSVSLSAMSLTTPLCAYYFGMVSLVGVLTNLLVLWIVSGIFYGIVFVCGLFLIFPAGALLLAKLVSAPIRLVLLTAKTMADIPLAAVYTVSPYITAWLVFVYVMLLFYLLSGNRKAGTLGCCAVIGLCMALIAGWIEPMLDDVRFTVLDVGQGQCLLFQTEGRTYMVDCGGDSDGETADIAAEMLLSQGITRLDGLILTHLDRDHAGAAENLLSRIETELLILPPVHSDIQDHSTAEVIYAAENLELTLEGTVIRIYAPVIPGNSNENSLCILFDTEKCDILITGDRNGFGERSLLRYGEIPDVNVLVAGHHGSKNATCEELLAAVRPEIVCISVGKDNSYGHPAPETLQRLQRYGCSVYRTDQNGTIIIRR